MICCPGTTQQQWRIKTIQALRKRMQQMDTKYELENTLTSAISEWFETGNVSLRKYPAKFHDAIWSQVAIGWRQIFNGKISRHWLVHQGHTKTTKGRLRMDYIWGALIVETCLRMMIKLWKMRRNKTTNKKRKSSYKSTSITQGTRDNTTKQRKALLYRCGQTNRNSNGGNT